MQTEIRSDLFLPPHAEVPFQTYHAVKEKLYAQQLARARSIGRAGARTLELSRAREKALQESVGERKYRQLRRYLTDARAAHAKTLEPPDGPKMSREARARLDQERKAAALEYMREKRINAEDLYELNARFNGRIAKIFPEPATVGDLLPVREWTVDTPPSDGWARVKPPYSGSTWFYAGSLKGFQFTQTLFLDASTGMVGHDSLLRDKDTGDDDYGSIDYNAAIGFWYRMPVAGLIEAWVEAQCIVAHHEYVLADEFGFSDSTVYQHNFISLVAVGAGDTPGAPQTTETSSLEQEGQNWGAEFQDYIQSGEIWMAHLFSDVTYPPGAWVWVNIGTLSSNFAAANDVFVHSEMNFRWFIKSVAVKSTGS